MTNTSEQLKMEAERSEWFKDEIERRARILGANVDAEGPHFRWVRAAEYLGRQGWTVEQVQEAAA
jgi:hypothetical protein